MGLGGAIVGGIIGAVFGHPFLGGAAGAILGDMVSSRNGEGQTSSGNENNSGEIPDGAVDTLQIFFMCLGKLAKSDGVVAQEEADFVKAFLKQMDLSSDVRKQLVSAFNDGKNSPQPFRKLVRLFAKHANSEMKQAAMSAFCCLVASDNVISPEERQCLFEAEAELNQPGAANRFFSEFSSSGQNDNRRNTGTTSASPGALQSAYDILGVSSSASDEEIKKVWRKKVLELHPDHLQGKGLSESIIRLAEVELNKINDAYKLIQQQRGMK